MSQTISFLKPTREKVRLAVFIAVLNIVVGLYSASAVLCSAHCPEPNAFQKLTAFSTYPIGIVFYIAEVFEELSFVPDWILETLYPFTWIAALALFWYLLACVVISGRKLTKYN